MIPIVSPDEMRAIDEAAPEPVEVLIDRAGAAVARAAVEVLGRSYGRRVVVVAGKGNNGADGRAAAARLRRRGIHVEVIDAASAPAALPACDVVIDAAYGTGFRGDYTAPDPGGAPVLAVDIPSGVDGRTGEAGDGAAVATATVTFAALKPGLLFGDGPARSGAVSVADIGLDVSRASAALVEDADCALLPSRPREAHKWQSAVCVVAGSPGMMGAPLLVASAAMRSGAGYVRLGVPGGDPADLPAGSEAVAVPVRRDNWTTDVLPELERCQALVIGPGLGRGEVQTANVRRLVVAAPVPVVIDADGLNALGDGALAVLGGRRADASGHGRPCVTVLTPHDGEFARLVGAPPGADRLGAARDLARRTGAVVLLKGPTTVVAAPSGDALVVTSGSSRLATAGTGDVLSGIIGAFLARGADPLRAAALAAHVHGRAASLGHAVGLVAGDLPDLVATWLSRA